MVDSGVLDKHMLARCTAKVFRDIFGIRNRTNSTNFEDIEEEVITEKARELNISTVALLHQDSKILLFIRDDVQGKVEFLGALSEVAYTVCQDTRHVLQLPDSRKIGLLFEKDKDFTTFLDILKVTLGEISTSQRTTGPKPVPTVTTQRSESFNGGYTSGSPVSLPAVPDMSAAYGSLAATAVSYGGEQLSQMASGPVSGTSLINPQRVRGGLAELVHRLQIALQAGDVQQARQVAGQLAEQRANVNLQLNPEGPQRAVQEKEIRVKVYVEDRESSGGCIVLSLRPSMTIEQLKKKVWLEHEFPPEVQKWIIGKKIAADSDTLIRCGLRGDMPAFLYLVSAASVGLTKEEVHRRHGHQPSHADREPAQVTTTRTLAVSPGLSQLSEQPPAHNRQTQDTERTSTNSDSSNGWECEKCTFITLWTREACDMCHNNRPPNLRPPANYKIPADEQRRLQQEAEMERLAEQAADRQLEQPRRTEAHPSGSLPNHPDQLELRERDLDLMLRLLTEHHERTLPRRATSTTTLSTSVDSTGPGAGRDMPNTLNMSPEDNDRVSMASLNRQIGFESDLENDSVALNQESSCQFARSMD